MMGKLRIDEEEELVGCDLTKHGQYAFLLDVDKVRGIESVDSPNEIAEKVRQASKHTHEIIKIVLAKRPDGSLPGTKSKFSKSMGAHWQEDGVEEDEQEEKLGKKKMKEPLLQKKEAGENQSINNEAGKDGNN